MFDLNTAVAAYTSRLAQSRTCSPADLAELDAHLRDAVERLRAAGLSPEESFIIAARRLGAPDQLALEYAAARPDRLWRDRAAWMLTGLLAWGAIHAVTDFFATAGFAAAALAGAGGESIGLTRIAFSLLGLAVTACLALALYRNASRQHLRLRPATWVLIGILAILLGRLASTAGNIVTFHYLSPTMVGLSAQAQAYLTATLGLLLPVACGLLILRLRRQPA